MALQADVGQADSFAFVTCKSLPSIRCLCSTVLLSLPLLLNACSAIVFKEGGCLAYCLQPCLSTCSLCHPLLVVNATGGEGFLHTLHISSMVHLFLIAHGQFTIQQELWQTVGSILETCPTQCHCILRSLALMQVTSVMSMT